MPQPYPAGLIYVPYTFGSMGLRVRVSPLSARHLYGDTGDVVQFDLAAPCFFGIEERKVDAVAHGAAIDHSIKAAFLDKLAEVLAWNIVNRCGIRRHRS